MLFRYTPTGEGATAPWTFLAGRTGYVQADAATVFDRLFTGQAAHAVEVGCLAHARRKLVALQDMDCRVAYPLKLIARLYRNEHLAGARIGPRWPRGPPAGTAGARVGAVASMVDSRASWLFILHPRHAAAPLTGTHVTIRRLTRSRVRSNIPRASLLHRPRRIKPSWNGFREDTVMTTTLSDSDFSVGGPEAWEPTERRFLESNFLPIKAFSSISERDKIFLCGRRGSGKSAIAVMMEHTLPYLYREAVEGENSEYGAYMDIVRDVRNIGADIDLKQAVRRLWLWALPVKAMQTVLNHATIADTPADSDLRTLQEYCDSLPEPLHQSSRIGDLLTHVFRRSVNSLHEGGTSAFTAHLIDLTGTGPFQRAVAALSRIAKANSVLVVFDTLESYRVFEPHMIEGLQGVVEAVIAFEADRRMEDISLKFFLPAEIYHRVFASFPGKVQSRAVFLRWRAADLISMLARRYLRVLERTRLVADDRLAALGYAVDEAYRQHDGRHLLTTFWYDNKFLPPSIRNRLGSDEDTFAYMLRHTQRRPRDLITQLQSIVDAARARGEFPYISTASVVAGVHEPKVLEQIVGDALLPYEGRLPAGLMPGTSSLLFGRPRIMSKRDLKRFAQELYSVYPLANIPSTDFLDLLFHCGMIGVVETEPAEREKYCKASFSYLMQGDLPQAERFSYCVHPALGDVLRMPSPAGRGAIYPMPEPAEDTWLETLLGMSLNGQ